MRRLLPVLLAVALMVPGVAMAKTAKKAAKAKKVVSYVDSDKCQGDKDAPAPKLGKEFVYLSADLKSVAMKKDETHTLKHQVFYYLPDGSYHRSSPGAKDGQALIPGFKHGEAWHSLSYDANGAMVVDNAAAASTEIAPAAPAADMGAPAPVKEKKAKKSKKSKKGKKAKKAKADAPATEEKKADAPKADAPATEEKK